MEIACNDSFDLCVAATHTNTQITYMQNMHITHSQSFNIHMHTRTHTNYQIINSSLHTGKVKFFDVTKGFGFISADIGEDIFVHQTAIKAQGFRSLAEGEDVEFDIETKPDSDKKFAINVTGPGGAYCVGAPKRSDGERRSSPRGNRRPRGGDDY